MLTVSGAVTAELAKGHFSMAYLVALPGGVYVTDWGRDLVHGGNTYQSSGVLLGVDTVRREQEVKLSSYRVVLSNVSTTIWTDYSTTNRVGQGANVFLAFLDSAGAIIDTITLYSGTLDTWAIKESASASTMELKLTSPWAAFRKTAHRTTSPAVHEQIYPGDTFFEMAHEDRSNLGWGRKD